MDTYHNYADDDEAARIRESFENAATNSSPSKAPATKNQFEPQHTIYQCLDGAMVIEIDGRNPTRSTMHKALSKFKDSPVIKLKDINLEMVEVFISHPAGAEALQGISPLCAAQNIAFDRDRPPCYVLIALAAMAASNFLAQVELFRSKGTSDPKGSLNELMYQIALIQAAGKIFPYE
jgi:hypothetical protein